MSNRVIKFRDWTGYSMDYEITVHDGKRWDMLRDCAIDGYPLMQFTGLVDKNGVEIWEGDVVRTYMGNICEIRWDFVSESSAACDYQYTGFCFHHIEQDRNYHLDVTSSCEVIGNIYQHPELLNR